MDVEGHQPADVVEGLKALQGFRSRRRRLGVAAGEDERQAQVGMTEGTGHDLTVLLRHRDAQLQVGDGVAELTLQGAQDAAGHQQPGPFRRGPGEPEQDLGQPVFSLPQQAGDLPVGAQVGGQPGRFPGRAGPSQGIAQGSPQVRMLGAQPAVARQLVVVLGVAAEFAGHGAEVRDVPVLGGVRVGGQLVQPFGPELADGVQQPVLSASSSVRSTTDLSTRPIKVGRMSSRASGPPAQTASAAVKSCNDPANTDSRAQSSCSCAEQRS